MAKRKKTHEEFVQDVFNLVNNEYIVKSQYDGSKKPITMFHRDCGELWDTIPSSFIRGYRCRKCSGNEKLTTEEFQRKINEKFEARYTLIGEYVNNRTKIKIRDNHHSTEFAVRPDTLLGNELIKPKGERCKKRRTTDIFEKEVHDMTDGEYKLIGEFIKVGVKTQIKHITCGNVYEVVPHNFLRGIRCPRCSSSKGEKTISKILATKNLSFKEEHKFNDCRDKRLLRFDFKVFDILIEYDGEQHFRKTRRVNSDKELWNVKRRDKIKNQYCIENNISLIRIPYTEQKNIEYILNNVLIHFGLIENAQREYDKEIVYKYLVDKNWNHDKYIEDNK